MSGTSSVRSSQSRQGGLYAYNPFHDGQSLAALNAELVLGLNFRQEAQRRIIEERCGLEGASTECQDFGKVPDKNQKPQDPEVSERLAEAQNFDSVNYLYSERAAKGEKVSDKDLVQAFPFHMKNGRQLSTGKKFEQPNMCLFRVLEIGELRSRVLGDLTFLDKKSLALASKETYKSIASFSEVWDTNRAEFLGNDYRLLQVGRMNHDQTPVYIKSSRVSFLMNRAWAGQGLAEDQFVKTTSSQGYDRKTLVADKMMPASAPVLLSIKGSTEIDHENAVRTEARHIMMTAIPFEPTAETYFKSPRLTYQNSLVHMLRGFEAILNVGETIETLDISGQTMLTVEYVDLMLSAVPNLRLLTLRKNHMMRISDTKQLMEVVHRRVPGCTLDFFPYFFYGAMPRDSEAEGVISRGTFGLTWEDYGIKTEKVIAILIQQILSWEVEYNMKVLNKGMGLHNYLHRLPLPSGFVDNIIRFWNKPDLGQPSNPIDWAQLHKIIDPDSKETMRQYRTEECQHCGQKTPQFLKHRPGTCALCSFEYFASLETDRYRREKEDISRSHLMPDNLIHPSSTLGMLLGSAELPAAASEEGTVIVRGLWDFAVGEWTPFNFSNAERQLFRPILRCRKLYKIRLRDLSRAYNPNKWRWVPTARFVIDCRKAGFRDRGPGDHEFFPRQHPNIFNSQHRTCDKTGQSYQVAFLPREFEFSSQNSYVRAAEWDRARVNFAKSKKQLEQEKWRAYYSKW